MTQPANSPIDLTPLGDEADRYFSEEAAADEGVVMAHRLLIVKDFRDTLAAIAAGDARKTCYAAAYCAHHGAALIRWHERDIERLYG